MNRITHIIWAARLCVLLLLLLVLCGAFPDFDVLIDLEEWLVNHLTTPLAVCFTTGLMAAFILAADLFWGLRLIVALTWLAALFAPLPAWSATTELALWLTTHTYDSFLSTFVAGLCVAMLASPGLWRSLTMPRRAASVRRQAPAAPIEPWHTETGTVATTPQPEPQDTEEPPKPEPWDIAPTVTVESVTPVAETVTEQVFPSVTEETAPDTLPITAKPETTITTPEVQETTAPAVEPWDVAPTVPMDNMVQTGLAPVSETATPPGAEEVHTETLPTPPAETPLPPPPVQETVVPEPPTPTVAEVVLHTPLAKAETTPEPWDIAPTVTLETAVQTDLAPVPEAAVTGCVAEAGTEKLPQAPAESALPPQPAQETVAPEPPAPTVAETTTHPPPTKAENTPEPWELTPTETPETATAVSPVESPVESIGLPPATETRPEHVSAVAPTTQPVAEPVEETRTEQLPTPVQAETTINTPKAAPLQTGPEPWELPPTVLPDDETRREDTVAQTAADDRREPMVTEVQTETADIAATAEAEIGEDAPVPVALQTVAADDGTADADIAADTEEEPTPAQTEEDVAPVTVDAVETENLTGADPVADEKELTATPVETDLPMPETGGEVDGQDFAAAFATVAAENDSTALPVVAYDIEPLPAPTLQPDMPPPTPANYPHWDNQTHFQTWQAAWLWHDWEPRTDDPVGPPCTARFLRLEDHLEKGMIRQAVPHSDGWMYAELPRQSLIDYAVACSEKPKFLFPEERSWISSRLRTLQGRDVPLHALSGYMPYNEVKLALYKILRSINSEAVATEVRAAMRRGLCEGVARRISGNITYGYERIPRMMWRRLRIDWLGNVSGGGHRYCGLMVRFRAGYLDTPQDEPPSAVEAYGAIDSYLREQDDSTPRTR